LGGVSQQMNLVIRHLRTAALQAEGPGLTDGQLLECFVSRRETTALEVLVRRHGPMVWDVCRRILGNHYDAEDALQATFLVLVRKAGSVTPREMVGNWLYGVAHQTALKAKATRAKRRMREAQQTTMPEPGVGEPDLWNDLQPVLDRELSLLPDKYRAVIVLCDLEGKSRLEAARQLGCPEGTVGSRLARARTMLAKRLARHGLAVSGGALAAVLSQKVASAGAPTSVMSSTISAEVAALTKGVMKAMLITKLKYVMGFMLAVVATVGLGAGLLAYGTAAGEQKDNENAKAVAPQKDDVATSKKEGQLGAELLWQPELIEGHAAISGGQKVGRKDGPVKQAGGKSDAEKIQGAWRMTAMIMDGKEIALSAQDKKSFYLAGEKFISTQFGWYDGDSPYTLDETQQPKAIDLSGRRGREIMRCIYKLKADELIICAPKSANMDRPKEFSAKPGSNLILMIYKRDPNALKLDLKKVEAQKEIKIKRLASARNLFRIGEAMRKYHDALGCFPPAAMCDASGKALLSWRVALLPHLGEDNLYQQFKLDEPWDSEDNKKLLAQMPEVFGPEGEKTYYQVFTGEATVFDGTKGIKERDITDSPAHTVLVVEAGQAVPWTKPQDLPYSAGRPLPKLGAEGAMAAIPPGHRTHGFYILAVDGVTHQIPMRFKEKVLRSLITRAGGESAFFEDLEKMQEGNAK
jgi:RNA polymerase sigma factor (sigma-70 family)